MYHITGAVNFVALGLKGRQTILTIHDIGHYAYTLKGWKKILYKKIWFDWPLNKVAFITTVSAFTRQQLVSVFSIDPSRIKVIHNPFPVHYIKEEKKYLSEIPKILQIGGSSNKNVERLIEAVEGLACELLLVRPFDINLDNKLKQKKIACTWYFDLTDNEIHRLYKDCDIVFFASTYEGFGMPILEAQATGRAVITSFCASMPEVAGGGAVLVDPYRIDEIRAALIKLISDDTYRNDCIEKGFVNLQRFHPDVIAQQYLEIYQQISLKK